MVSWVLTSVGWTCNFFYNSQVHVSDFFFKKSATGPGLWKLEISNNRLISDFLNVSEQQVWGGFGGSIHLKVGIQSRVFTKNPAQYPIEFLKLFQFFDKNPHNHSWFFTRFLEMKYSNFFTCTKPIHILGSWIMKVQSKVQRKNFISKAFWKGITLSFAVLLNSKPNYKNSS